MLEARAFTTRRVIPLPTHPVPRQRKIMPPELICYIIQPLLVDYITEILSEPDIPLQWDAFLDLLQCNRSCRAIVLNLMAGLLAPDGVPTETLPGLFLLNLFDDLRRLAFYHDAEEPLLEEDDILEEDIFVKLPVYQIYKVLWFQKKFMRTIWGGTEARFDCGEHRNELLRLPGVLQTAAATSTDTMKEIFRRGLQSVMELEHELIVYREMDRIGTRYTKVIEHHAMLRKIARAYDAGMLSFSRQQSITNAVLNHLTEEVTTPDPYLSEDQKPVDLEDLQVWAEQFGYSPLELGLTLTPHRITADTIKKMGLERVVASLPAALGGMLRYWDHSDVALLCLPGVMKDLEKRSRAFGVEEALYEAVRYPVLEYWRTGVEPIGFWVPIPDRNPPGVLDGREWEGFAQMFTAAIANK